MYTITLQGREGDRRQVSYDPHSSKLLWDTGEPVALGPFARGRSEIKAWSIPHRVNGAAAPGTKGGRFSRIKIQLGLKCNYECSYCLQRFQPEHDDGNLADVQAFLRTLPTWYDGGEDGQGAGTTFQFWGGEPFVYWKKLQILGPALKSAYPNATFGIVTNGSILSDDIIDWIVGMDCDITISHDGPGQHERGPDPLDDPNKKAMILKLMSRMPEGRLWFAAVLTAGNHDMTAIRQWFIDKLGVEPNMSTEGIVLPYTDDGFSTSLLSEEKQREFMWSIFRETIAGTGGRYGMIRAKIEDFFGSLELVRPASALGQKCRMDRADQLAVTLKGDVVTCQNVSPTAAAGNGESHLIGRVDDLAAARLKTATHWSFREECSHCPVLQLCKGSCMFLQGDKWKQACDNEFAFNMGVLMAALFLLTGMAPAHIDGPMRKPLN